MTIICRILALLALLVCQTGMGEVASTNRVTVNPLFKPFTNTNDASARLFDGNRLLDVRIEIAPADWDVLRIEHRDLMAALGPARFDHPEPKPYKIYKADVTIDGVAVKSIGLRKRGFIGSGSPQRPSLGIHFDEYDKDGQFSGLKRMALNNNLQDSSQIHQALAYRVFASAGVPAPRCSFARVTVNGKYLGVYSHVEAIEAEFLKRRFGEDRGNLYEGQVSDFKPELVKTFERKNHKKNASREDLDSVVKALQAGDAQLIAQLEPRVDIDEYLSYWAVESLIGHWDSYSNDGNNFLIYAPATTKQFVFIPWGADSVFGDPDPFTPFQTPESVKAHSLLPYRLYRLPATQERYRERLRQILKQNWNESELLAEVSRLEALLKPHVQVTTAHFEDGISKVRQFIRTRREALKPELDGAAPRWDFPPRKAGSLTKVGNITATFSTDWQETRPLNPMKNGTVDLAFELDGKKQEYTALGVSVNPSTEPRHPGCPTITIIGMPKGSLQLQILAFVIQPEFYKPGQKTKVNGFDIGGAFVEGHLFGKQFTFAGFPLGSLELEASGTNAGDKVSGKIQADIYRMFR